MKTDLDRLNERFAAALIKHNVRLINCIDNEEYEHAASVRDEIKESIKATAILLSPFIGKPILTIIKTLQDQNIFVFNKLMSEK